MSLDDLGTRRASRTRRPFRDWERGNERVKLTATYLNGIAIAFVAVGALRFAFSPEGEGAAQSPLWIPLAISVALHLIALSVLRFFNGKS